MSEESGGMQGTGGAIIAFYLYFPFPTLLFHSYPKHIEADSESDGIKGVIGTNKSRSSRCCFLLPERLAIPTGEGVKTEARQFRTVLCFSGNAGHVVGIE